MAHVLPDVRQVRCFSTSPLPPAPPRAQGVVSYLESEFQTLIAKKDATTLTLEPRVS